MKCDLLLRGGQVVNPADGFSGEADVLIREGKILALLPPGSTAQPNDVIDVRGQCVLPGLVDMHVHASEWLGGRFGHRMLALAGVTTALDMSGPIEGVLRMARNHGAGLNIASIEYVRPGETVASADPGTGEIRSLLTRALESGSIGLKLLGGHYPLTPEATAGAMQVVNEARAYVAFHAGTLSTGSHIEGMLEAVRLSDGNAFHLAHVNSYCRGAVRDHMAETEEAIASLLANPRVVSESYLGLINGTSAQCIAGLPASKVTDRCLRIGGFSADEAGMEAAILDGWAQINMEMDGQVVLATGVHARDHWRQHETNVPVSFAVNPPEPRLRLAAARRSDRSFVVDALSTDGGGIPRNVLLAMGLSLVKLEVLDLVDFARKASLNPARILGLTTKGHLSPGADADITVVDLAEQKAVMTMVNGQINMYHGLVLGRGSKIVVTERGAAAVSRLGLTPVVVDLEQSWLYAGRGT